MKFNDDNATLALLMLIAIVLILSFGFAAWLLIDNLVAGTVDEDGDGQPDRIPFGRFQATPEITWNRDSAAGRLQIVSIDRNDVSWAELDVKNCNRPGNDTTVTAGDTLVDCVGEVRVIYAPNNDVLYHATFPPSTTFNVLHASIELLTETGASAAASASSEQHQTWDIMHSVCSMRAGTTWAGHEHTAMQGEHVQQLMFGCPNIKAISTKTPGITTPLEAFS